MTTTNTIMSVMTPPWELIFSTATWNEPESKNMQLSSSWIGLGCHRISVLQLFPSGWEENSVSVLGYEPHDFSTVDLWFRMAMPRYHTIGIQVLVQLFTLSIRVRMRDNTAAVAEMWGCENKQWRLQLMMMVVNWLRKWVVDLKGVEISRLYQLYCWKQV